MSRGITPQKAFLMDHLRRALALSAEQGELKGAKVRDGDRNTLVIRLPATVGPAAEFSITVREMML